MVVTKKVSTKEEIIKNFGLDTGDAMEWKRWEPGGEYTKKLIIRNVRMKTQHLKYSLPSTKYFGMDFPETIVLSPGMSYSIPITFRPIEYHPYDDVVGFTTDDGVFYILVRAVVPHIAVDVPSSLEFENCPANEFIQKQISIKNTGQVDFNYQWKMLEPFSIEPTIGNLQIGKTASFTVTFSPKVAGVWEGFGVCTVGDSITKEMKLKGMSKYPFITLSKNTLSFGEVYTGKTAQMEFLIQNLSLVRTSFKIKRVESDIESRFVFSTTSGEVPANGTTAIQVTFAPVSTFMESSDTYLIQTPGGNTVQLKCFGTAIGPRVVLSTNSINFGSIVTGASNSKILTIQNFGNDVAVVQFYSETSGIFNMDNLSHSQTTVPPRSSIEIKISFTPKQPINYHKRIFVLVKNENPTYLDLIGTGYTDKSRPPDFTQHHVDVAIRRQKLGFSKLPPEKLETTKVPDEVFSENTITYDTPQIYEEYLKDEWGNNDVTIRESWVDFGACSTKSGGDYRTIHVTNNTQGKVSCTWMCPGELKKKNIFSVSPELTDLVPGETAEFKITFNPNYDNQYYGQKLECYVFYKTMRNFRLVTEQTITAPWCLSVYASGHTFPVGSETFLPNAQFQAKKLNFPATHVNTCVYQTISLSNHGDTPVSFQFANPENTVFRVKPTRGTLQPNQQQLLLCKFSPKEPKKYTHVLKCIMNNSSSNILELPMIGYGAVPSLTFENQNSVYFKPTSVGSSTKRHFKVSSTSPITTKFKIEVPEKFANVVKFEPMEGQLIGNQEISITVVFSPQKIREYDFKVPVRVSSVDLPQETPRLELMSSVRVVGEGTKGVIKLDPPLISFESILIGSTEKKELTLYNESPCYVTYHLSFKQSTVKEDTLDLNKSANSLSLQAMGSFSSTKFDFDVGLMPNETEEIVEPVFKMTPVTGIIPAYGSTTVSLYFTPPSHNFYTFTIKCDTSTEGSKEEKSQTCEAVGVGVFPSVKMADIRSDGISNYNIWRQFSITQLNQELEVDLDDIETSLMKFEGLLSQNPLVDRLTTFNFDFGTSLAGSPVTSVYLFIENNGPISADFSFVFLSKLEVKKEKWVDLGKPSELEQQQAFIIENNIFSIFPPTGRLEPGHSTRVKLSYKHTAMGFHDTPVIFRLKHGKQIRLILKGHTLGHSEPHLACVSEQFLKPIPLGTECAPLQTIELLNDSASQVKYEVDTKPLQQLTAENYNFPVIQCLNPSGVIAPNTVLPLQIVVKPIEEKQYDVTLPIKTTFVSATQSEKKNANQPTHTTQVTLHARGYNQRTTYPQELGSHFEDFGVDMPKNQVHEVPGQLAKLSTERMDFGKVPSHTLHHRIVTLFNVSTVKTSFVWNLEQLPFGDVIEVVPKTGALNPGSHTLCKIAFHSNAPQVFEFDVPCTVYNDKEKKKQDAMMEEPDEEVCDFFISDDGVMNITRSQAPADVESTSSRSTRTKASLDSGFVKRTTSDKPAAPFIKDKSTLYIHVKAHVVEPSEFKAENIDNLDEINRFYTPLTNDPFGRQQAQESQKLISSPSEIENSLSTSALRANKDMFAEIVEEMLEDVIRSPDIEIAVKEMAAQPPPLFAQLYRTPSHKIEERIPPAQIAEKNLFGSSEFQEFVHSVLGETIFNLMAEVSSGEFDLLAKPKIIVNPPAELKSNVLRTVPPNNNVPANRHVKFTEGK